MNKIKKIVALLLAIVIMVSIPVCTFAAEEAEKESILGADNVATMYLVFTSANPKVPHLWIYIENETNETLNIGPYKLKPNGAVSMGAWKDRGDGAGIYINLERHWVKDATYGRAFYIKTNVSRSELKRIGNSLDRHNYWNWGLNCAWFATSIWNICSVKFVPFLISPRLCLVVMLAYGAKRPDFKFKKEPNESNCYKYITGGTLKKCSYGATVTSTGV